MNHQYILETHSLLLKTKGVKRKGANLLSNERYSCPNISRRLIEKRISSTKDKFLYELVGDRWISHMEGVFRELSLCCCWKHKFRKFWVHARLNRQTEKLFVGSRFFGCLTNYTRNSELRVHQMGGGNIPFHFCLT